MTLPGRRILLVHGLMGEVMAALRPIGIDYMQSLAAWLREERAEVSVVKLPTAEPIIRNGLALRAAIAAEPRPPLVIAHSKGGLEALTALIDPGTADRCAGFIALQSPFFGSPVADLVTATPALDATATTLAHLLRIGSGEGIRDLTTTRRHAWMTTHAAAIQSLTNQIPILCVATTIPARAAHGRDRAYAIAATWMRQRGAGPSDGLVPLSSALIPGAPSLIREGSHIACVSQGQGRDPVGILKAALEALG
ncbi:esterase/lipase family protein [Plastoroseomonas arctica]|uniref:Alpha/beta hydrolase n=1 Tax=Plastoroseomonas arctica TaxID=1509237 RepID=A0AAF1JW06_9PROT|nr:hypothetical protein [Plastoroseomonas arctica]MBR0654961.1 hypothetical protein [Plastoroseomonas arctica]